jgi:hypothetical protein
MLSDGNDLLALYFQWPLIPAFTVNAANFGSRTLRSRGSTQDLFRTEPESSSVRIEDRGSQSPPTGQLRTKVCAYRSSPYA